jgi:CRP-like cAMP-binding protein
MNQSADMGPLLDQFTGLLDTPDSIRPEEGNATTRSLYSLIERQPFFRGLSAHHLQLLTDSGLETRFDSGQTIFAEGSPANRFYLILTGKVVLGSEQEDHNILPVQTLGPGDDLGWSWLFPPYSLHLSARAIEPTRTVFFYGPRLREQCEQDHEFGYQLMKRVAEVTTQCLHATQLRLSEYIDRNRLAKG